MLTEYEAWVLTKFRTDACPGPYRSRSVTGPTAIGLILIETLASLAYERTRSIESRLSAAFNLEAAVPPTTKETNSVAP